MNIFYLDSDPILCAQYTVDKHVVKMITEHNQLLCTAHHVFRSKLDIPYKRTHENHPSAIWARSGKENYISLCIMTLSLCNEYTYRYGKLHAGEEVAKWALNNVPNLPSKPFYPPTCAMDDHYKIKSGVRVDSILSYRNYYRLGKKHLHVWSKRSKPEWL